MADFFSTYSTRLQVMGDSLQTAMRQAGTPAAADGVEGITRTHSESVSSWTTTSMLLLTVLVFIIVYRQRLYIAYRLRDFFAREELFTFSKPQAVSNNYFAMGSLLLLSCCSLGLIVSGLSAYGSSVGTLTGGQASGDGFRLGLLVAWYAFLYVGLKGLIYAVVNWVFFKSGQNVRWVSSYFFLSGVFSFLLYPFALIVLFAGFSVKLLTLILLFLFILYEIMLFYKLLVNFKVKKYGYLLIFLYFCAVELLPALFVWQKVRM